MEKFYFGFDVGGTNIKAGVISWDNRILFSKTSQTNLEISLAQNIFSFFSEFEKQGFALADAEGIGIGVPGWVDEKQGVIKFSGNLKLKDYPLKQELLEQIGNKDIKIFNDAYTATLAEKNLGSGKGFDNFLMLTIGTGIGGGIVLNGEVLTNSCELGHMKVTDSPIMCSCGERGCFEAVASTKALISMTREAMLKNKNSKMWESNNENTISGKTVFENMNDFVAREVFEKYIQNLGEGIVSLINVLQPEAVILSGAITKQAEILTAPLEKFVNEHTFGKNAGRFVKILSSNLCEAGLLGTKQLFN